MHSVLTCKMQKTGRIETHGLPGPLATPALSVLHCLQIPACSECQRWLASWWTELLLSRLWYPKRDSFLLSPFSVSVSSLSFGFLHLLLLFLQTESQSLLLPCFSSLFFVFSFLFFLFYCLPSWSHSNARMKEETPSVLCLFFSPNCLPLLRFLSFFFCFSLFSPFFFCLASLLFFPFVFPFLGHQRGLYIV